MKNFISKHKDVIKIVLIILGTIILAVVTALIVFKPKNNTVIYEPVSQEQLEEKAKANMVYYLDNRKVDKMPNNGYKFISASCDNEAKITFNQEKWIYEVTNVTNENTVCNIYFENDIKKRNIIFNYNGGKGDTTSKQVQVGGTYGELPNATYENHKFIGWFEEPEGGESVYIWNIMPDHDVTLYAHYETIEKFSSIIEKKIKYDDDLVKVGNDYRFSGKDPCNYVDVPGLGSGRIIGVFDGTVKVVSTYTNGQKKQWNTNANKNDENSNKWKESSLYDYLNIDYYNGMSSTFKNVVKKHDWNVGKASEDDTPKTAYEKEKKETVNAYLGLISASDYAYAAEEKCWDEYIGDSVRDCKQNNWLYSINEGEWTITPSETRNDYALISEGKIKDELVTKKNYYRISFFLVDDLVVENASIADGTSRNPYRLSK